MQVLGWGLLHSLWQGAVVWLLLLAVFRLFPAMSSRLKHTCALAALSLLLLWVGNTCLTQWQAAETAAVRVIPGSAATAGNAYVIHTPGAQQAGPAADLPLLQQLQATMPWLMLCYALGVLFMVSRLGGGLMQLHRLRTRNLQMPDDRLLAMLERLRLEADITARVTLRISFRITTPIVIGALRPLILLPASMLESLGPEGLEAILLHELAHITRGDYFINILLSIAECLLFFNPFVWRLCAAVRREREHCCDDFVIAHTVQPAAYAYALAGLASLQQSSVLAPAATGNARKPLLLNRIKRIMEAKNTAARPAPIILTCCIAAIIIATSIACFSPSLAQRSRKPKDKAEQVAVSDSTDNRLSGTIIIDSGGHRRQYSSIDKMPPEERAALKQHLRDLDDTLRNIGPRIAAGLAGLGDSISTSVAQAMAAVDWNQIDQQIDSAMRRVDAIDWQKVNRTIDRAVQQAGAVNWEAISEHIERGLAEADRSLKDPKVKAEMRRAMAMARREMEQSRSELRRDQQNMRAELRRSAEEARRDAEQARREAEELRRELEQVRQERQRERKQAK
jgi:beta-lactamase regulating signal transducer with metallopeptidase domain